MLSAVPAWSTGHLSLPALWSRERTRISLPPIAQTGELRPRAAALTARCVLTPHSSLDGAEESGSPERFELGSRGALRRPRRGRCPPPASVLGVCQGSSAHSWSHRPPAHLTASSQHPQGEHGDQSRQEDTGLGRRRGSQVTAKAQMSWDLTHINGVARLDLPRKGLSRN